VKAHDRMRIGALEEGDYLATYSCDERDDVGSRCGYSDSELASIRSLLTVRDLRLEADDRGLRVVRVEVQS
jgi:hypothetical protein